MITVDTTEVRRYLDLLYADAPPATYLVVWWVVNPQETFSQWYHPKQISRAVRQICMLAKTLNVYIGLGLRHPHCQPDMHTRGTNADVSLLPGAWIELDHNAGTHAAANLPTPTELLAFIEDLPFHFSLLVDSGGGYHGYCLFKELWHLDTPEEHQAATLLLRRFQRTVQSRAAERGWHVDTTSDLARVLRPPGTLNHKSGTPKPVTILHEEALRYNPSDLADAPWLATIEDTYTPPARNGRFPPTPLAPIVEGCAWLRHCRDDAATLDEPQWYSMLGIIGRTTEGEQCAHEWSAPYQRYSKEETTQKLTHALAAAGPSTCTSIRYDRAGEPYCRECAHWGKIKSPIVLGMSRRRARAAEPAAAAPSAPEDLDWTAQLMRNQKGHPIENITNLSLILENHPEWKEAFWFDTVRALPMYGDVPIDDTCLITIARQLGLTMSLSMRSLRLLESCVRAVCQQTPRDLLKEWLEALSPWDGVERLREWLHDVAGVTKDQYGMDISRLIPVSMVARALNPGCQYRYVVYFEGRENSGKTALVRTLASQAWYVAFDVTMESKEAFMLIQGTWVAELSEFATLSRTEEAKLKSFLTQQEDVWIPKYSNSAHHAPRRTIFIGTCNPGEVELRGQTGNTRFLPIKTGEIDCGLLENMRPQLFAEALVYYREHPDTWWQLSEEGSQEAIRQREERRQISIYETDLPRWLAERDSGRFIPGQTSWPEIAEHYLHIDKEKWKDKSLQMQIGQALRADGWERGSDGSVRFWRKRP